MEIQTQARPEYRLDKIAVTLEAGLEKQVAEVLGVASIKPGKGRYDITGCSDHCLIVINCTDCNCVDYPSTCSCDSEGDTCWHLGDQP